MYRAYSFLIPHSKCLTGFGGRSRLIVFNLFCLSYSLFNYLVAQNNLIINGDLSHNQIFVPPDETRVLPYLEDFNNPVYIWDVKGLFFYPYEDSFVYLGLKYGSGFHRKRSLRNYYNYSEACGKFVNELSENQDYLFQFDYFPYWGNCLMTDSIPLVFLDKNGKVTNSIKIFIGNDSPFQRKTYSAEFRSNGKERFFCLKIDSNTSFSHTRVPLFEDALLTRRFVKYQKLWSTYLLTEAEFLEERQMKETKPFVYYMLNNFICRRPIIDSSQFCQLVYDTTYSGTVFYDPDQDSFDLERLHRQQSSLYDQNILIKVYTSDAKMNHEDSNAYEISINRVEELFNRQYHSETQIERLIETSSSNEHAMQLKRNYIEIYTIRKRFANCIKG